MSLIDLIFPKTCLECGKEGGYICPSCLKKVGKGVVEKDVISIFRYEGVIKKAITSLKYKYATEISTELAGVCIQKLSNHHLQDVTLVPIPVHWRKENVRGFNQAAILGKTIAAGMRWKFEPNLLIKKVSTLPQVGLKGCVRRENLKNAFILNSGFKISNSIVLFDDVYTTGSTLQEASSVLKKAGIEEVYGLTIAR